MRYQAVADITGGLGSGEWGRCVRVLGNGAVASGCIGLRTPPAQRLLWSSNMGSRWVLSLFATNKLVRGSWAEVTVPILLLALGI